MNWNEVFIYEKETGFLFFRERPLQCFKSKRAHGIFNALCAGKRAGTTRSDGYEIITVNGKRCYAHRIIWEMHNGPIPKGMVIDHIEYGSNQNRIENLRLATKSENSCNSKARRSISGYKGVTVNHIGKYTAHITKNYKSIHLGSYITPEEAHMAYRKAARELFGEFAKFK